MATVAKLTQDGELRLSGGINTRLPLITDGLVAHYPMDGTTKGIANNNILDYSTWNIGTSGSQTGFAQNGDGNSIIEDFGPFGEYQPIWQALGNDTTSDADGGWNGSSFAIDRTKKYRHSVWIRRKVTGNGTGYFGCLGSSVYNIAANTVNTNPYFWAGGLPNNDWLLFVSYVYPSDIGNVVPTDDAGIYNTAKTKLSSIGTFKFSPTATTNNHRTYLYYSTLATTNQQWAYPRVDLCDGTEPSLDDLLSGEGNVINPYSESSITKTNDYVGIEEATTNLIPSSIAFDSTVWSARENVTVTLNQLDPFGGYNAIKIHPNSTTDNYFGVRTDVLGIGTYTTSIWLRASKECSVVLNTGTRSSTGAYITYTAHLTREWKLFNYSGTTTANPVHCFHIGGWNTWTDNTFDIFMMNPQVEQKAFATEYVDGSRSSSGALILPTNIGTDDFTITGTFIPNYNSDSLANGSYFLNLGSGFILSTYNGLPYINGNVITGSSNQNVHLDYNTIAGDEVSYTIKRSGTTFTWNMKDSRQDIIWTKIHTNVPLISVDNITFSGTWGGAHKNLSIYNRALSDNEVLKNVKGTHTFTEDGLITKSISSSPVVPDGANYFPLDIDGKDYYKSILPTKNENTVYIDGSVFIGSGTTNIVTSAEFETAWSAWDSAVLTYEDQFVDGKQTTVVNFTETAAGTANAIHRAHTVTNGQPYTLSAYIRINPAETVDSTTLNMYINGYVPRTISKEWKRFSITQTATATSHTIHLTQGALVDMQIAFVQLEQSSILTPFVNGARSQSSLHLPYNIIDCKQDFTIYGWWYPKVYADGVYRPCLTRNIPDSNDTGNRILIMNGSSTTSNKLWCWYGSAGSEANFGFSTKAVTINEWNFFCLRRSGNNVYLTHGDSNSIEHTSHASGAYLNSDETGQVWQVGEYANSESDAYHRDYVFYQGAMTDAEIERVFKTKMSAKVSGLTMNGINSTATL